MGESDSDSVNCFADSYGSNGVPDTLDSYLGRLPTFVLGKWKFEVRNNRRLRSPWDCSFYGSCLVVAEKSLGTF